MTERIEELIVSYLHRGSTPEQERELFEACRSNPEVASLLRQHITLSLKLRMLRDKTEVPRETHNALMRRINETKLHAESDRRKDSAWSLFGSRTREFGWRHLTGTALATAAVMAVIFFLVQPPVRDESGSPRSIVTAFRTDTVTVSRIDTVLRTRTLRTPVYIVRYEKPEHTPQEKDGHATMDVPAGDLAQHPAPDQPANAPRTDTHEVDAATIPAIAENTVSEPSSYILQYTTMVTSLERIRLSYSDRVRQ